MEFLFGPIKSPLSISLMHFLTNPLEFAACARQSAPGGFKRRSDPTIGREDIEYLPIDWRGGKAAACLCGAVSAGLREFEKKPEVATVPRKW